MMQHFGFGGFVGTYMYNWDAYRTHHMWEMMKYEQNKGRGTKYAMRSYYAKEASSW